MASSFLKPENEDLAMVYNRELLWTISHAFPMSEAQRQEYMKILQQRKDNILLIFLENMIDKFNGGATLEDLKAKICRLQEMIQKAFFETIHKLQHKDEDQRQQEPPSLVASDTGVPHVRAIRHYLHELRENLMLGRNSLLDDMIAHNILTNGDRQQIMAIASEPRRNEAFVDYLCANLSPETFKDKFLPLLFQDSMHSNIAEKLLHFFEESASDTGTGRCVSCRLQSQNTIGKLADALYEKSVISKALKTELQQSAQTTRSKWKLLQDNVQDDAEVMLALETAYPDVYSMYLKAGESPLVCNCCRKRSGSLSSSAEDFHTEITDELRECARNQTADILVQVLRQAGFPSEMCDHLKPVLRGLCKKFHEHYMAFLQIIISSSESAADVLKTNNYMVDIIITSLRQEISELAPGRQTHISLDTMRGLRKLLPELYTDLNLECTLLHRMLEKGMINDSDTDIILAHTVNRDKVDSFLEYLTVSYTEESFRAHVLPLLSEDDGNRHLVHKIQHVLDNPRDDPRETRCTHCQLVGLGINRRLPQCMLQHGFISEAVKGDLCNPGIPTKAKWQQIKEHMNEQTMLQVLKETFPILARLIALRNEPLLRCCCDVANQNDFDSTATQPTGNTPVDESVDVRIRKILGRHFRNCSVSVVRLGEERQQMGPRGGRLQSSLLPQIYLTVPPGTLTDLTTVTLYVQHIASDLVQEEVWVSPIVTLGGLKNGQDGATLTLPVPMSAEPFSQGEDPQRRTVLLCILTRRLLWKRVLQDPFPMHPSCYDNQTATPEMSSVDVSVTGFSQTVPVTGQGRYFLVSALERSEAESVAGKIQCCTLGKTSADQYVVSLTTLGQSQTEESMSVITELSESLSLMECEEEPN